MKYEIAKKFLRGAQESTIRADFPVKFHGGRRQVSVNRRSMSLLAMKYAISGSFSSECGFGMSLHPATSMPRTTTEIRSNVRHEVCNWQKFFSCALGWWAARERPSQDLSQAHSEGQGRS